MFSYTGVFCASLWLVLKNIFFDSHQIFHTKFSKMSKPTKPKKQLQLEEEEEEDEPSAHRGRETQPLPVTAFFDSPAETNSEMKRSTSITSVESTDSINYDGSVRDGTNGYYPMPIPPNAVESLKWCIIVGKCFVCLQLNDIDFVYF